MPRVRRNVPVLAVIAAGGVLGSLVRHALGSLQHGPPSWPWATLLVNVTGCLVIGALMVVLLELTAPHRLLRPFLGVGVLGGYTTFSTFAVDVQVMLVHERYGGALLYLAVTPVAALVALWLGTAITRTVLMGRGSSAEEVRA
ncbi:fluoride efflux transporter FluC [Jiangella asiatica]|uniref:Fluoride-specific ion channel FluC n=1 Tax=Jiangella asiatica TaxID=2530372 RepID=A0A4R5DN36_9ACTN|nr:CrcB family protein [Jiangella asiatica]TDE13480.1 CrcB family protein [Jiangella asiatica]